MHAPRFPTFLAVVPLAFVCLTLALVLPTSAATTSNWAPTVDVRANSTTASAAVFAYSPGGVAVVAWTEANVSASDDVWISSSDFSGYWTPPLAILDGNDTWFFVDLLAAAVDVDGRVAVLVAVQTYDDINATFDWQWLVVQSMVGGGVSSVHTLSNSTFWSTGRLAYAAGGVLHALLEDPADGVNVSIKAYRYEPGTGWAGPATLATASGGWFPGLAVLSAAPSGLAGAAWTVFNETGYAVEAWGSVFAPATEWGAPELLGSDEAGAVGWSVTATTDRAIFGYSEYNATRGLLRTREIVASVGLSTPTNVSDASTGAAWVQVVVDDHGYQVATWQETGGGARHIWAARRAPGGAWSPSGPLDTAAGNASPPQISVDAGGGAMVAWSQPSAGNATVWAARFAPVGGWQAPVALSDGLGPKALSGVGSAGDRTVVAWWGRVGPLRSVTAAMFERDSVPPGLSLDWVPEIVNTTEVTISGTTEPGAVLLIDGAPFGVDPSGYFAVTFSFGEGVTVVWVEAFDMEGNHVGDVVVVTVDIHCDLTLLSPTEGITTNASVILVSGTVEAGADVLVLGVPVPVLGGTFTTQAVLRPGNNLIWVQAVDAIGNVAVAQANVTFDDPLVPVLASLAEATVALDQLESALANESMTVASLGAELASATAALDAAESQLVSIAANGTADAARIGELQGLLASEQQRANATAASLQAAQDKADAAQDEARAAQDRADAATSRAEAAEAAAGTAQLLGVLGVMLGIVGIVMGLLAGRKRRPTAMPSDTPMETD